jgi:hypothetical protein
MQGWMSEKKECKRDYEASWYSCDEGKSRMQGWMSQKKECKRDYETSWYSCDEGKSRMQGLDGANSLTPPSDSCCGIYAREIARVP